MNTRLAANLSVLFTACMLVTIIQFRLSQLLGGTESNRFGPEPGIAADHYAKFRAMDESGYAQNLFAPVRRLRKSRFHRKL